MDLFIDEGSNAAGAAAAAAAAVAAVCTVPASATTYKDLHVLHSIFRCAIFLFNQKC